LLAPTQASIRRKLAEAEAQDLEAGRNFVLDENVSPSTLISLGIDLEMAQYVPCSHGHINEIINFDS
jgi:hypothetical protein